MNSVFARHKRLHALNHYTGILSLQALARHAVKSKNADAVETARAELMPFATGAVPAFGNFPVYRAGGNGAALLHWKGRLPEADEILMKCAELQMAAPRGEDGVFCAPQPHEVADMKIWIDTAFGVCPYLIACGRAFDRKDFVDEAVHQILAMYRLFLDEACGLVHQGMNFNGPGSISHDHWSRGNGWGLLAIAEVLDWLPRDDSRAAECESILCDWLKASLQYQNHEGLWYQEMTNTNPRGTYTETSGSGLILFALGVALERGLMEESRPAFVKGLQGLLRYITPDGSVFHTCTGCRCPGDGSIAAYLQRPPVINDNHAFGSVLMAFGQAFALGYREIELPEDEL